MKHKLLILMLVASFPIFGQQHIVGIKGGVNLPNFYFSNTKDFNYVKINTLSGFTYEYKLWKQFSIKADILYFQTENSYGLFVTENSGSPTWGDQNVIHNFNYLSVPIKASINSGNKISGYFAFGLVPAYLINAKTRKETIFGSLVEENVNITDYVSKFDLGFIVEIGANYKIKEKYILSIALANQESLIITDINSETILNGIRHHSMQLSLGLKYILK